MTLVLRSGNAKWLLEPKWLLELQSLHPHFRQWDAVGENKEILSSFYRDLLEVTYNSRVGRKEGEEGREVVGERRGGGGGRGGEGK